MYMTMYASRTIHRWFAVFCVIAGFSLLGVAAASAQEPEQTPTATPVTDCGTCHLNVVVEWQNSRHAQAYHDPAFQAAWEARGRETRCLACHTTGFVPRTGAYDTEGVSCAACHGEPPANHPPEHVQVDPGVGVCADCHAVTFSEWQMSAHGEQQLACTTCHVPHTQQVRFETSTALCLNCHDQARTDYAHITHAELACVDCHWFRRFDNDQHVLTGELMPTGHDNRVETRTCIDCHATLAAEGGTYERIGNGTHPLLAAQVQIAELQTQVETVRAQGQNNAVIQLAAGLAMGALLSGGVIIAIAGIWRRRR